jgi:hypothetical protein
MKKLLISLFLLVVSPVLLATTASNTDASTNQSPYANQAGFNQNVNDPNNQQKHIQFLTDQQPVAPQDSLTLSNADLGLYGPVNFSTTYSQVYGMIVSGQYTQALGNQNALSFLADGSKKEGRANLTWGYAMTPRQRIKLTGEYLAQDMDFNYYSGEVKRWENQEAYGATYEYIVAHHFLNDINFNTFYSHTGSSDLSNVNYDGATNLRRIAGGTDKSASTGVDVLPTQSTLVGLQLNYDDVTYNTHYQNNQNTTGFGATINLQQLITQRVKLQLLAADRNPINTYGTEVDYLVKTTPGTRLELAITGERDIAQGNLTNDSRVGLNVNYAWGGSSKNANAQDNNGYQLASVDSANDLTNWSSNPAVKMSQVLAVTDQALQLPSDSQNPSLGDGVCNPNYPVGNPNYSKVKTITVMPGQVYSHQDLGVVTSDERPSATNGTLFIAPQPYQVYIINYNNTEVTQKTGLSFSVSPIPESDRHYHVYLDGTVIANPITVNAEMVGWNYILIHDKQQPCAEDTQTITLQAGAPVTPTLSFAPPQTQTNPWILKMGQTFPSGNTGTYTPASATISFSPNTLAQYGINANVGGGNITFNGTGAGQTITNYTTSVQTYTVTATTPSHNGKMKLHGTGSVSTPLSIVVLTPPVGDAAQISGGTYASGATITAAPFASHFNDVLPSYDGGILTGSGYAICQSNINPAAPGSNCAVAGDASKEFGLQIDSNGVISGALDSTATPGDHTLYVFARNVQMSWNNVSTQTPNYHFTVTEQPATVSFTPSSQPWILTVGQTFPSDHYGDYTPAQDSVTFAASAEGDLHYHGVTATATNGHITFAGTLANATQNKAIESFPVTVGTRPTPTGNLQMVIIAPPKGDGAQVAGGNYHTGDTVSSVDFSGHFTDLYSTYDGGISASAGYAVCQSDLKPDAPGSTCAISGSAGTELGLSINNAGNLSGQVSASEGSYQLFIFAKNTVGWNNVDGQKPSFTFTIIPSPVPTIAFTPDESATNPWILKLGQAVPDGHFATYTPDSANVVFDPSTKSSKTLTGYGINATITNPGDILFTGTLKDYTIGGTDQLPETFPVDVMPTAKNGKMKLHDAHTGYLSIVVITPPVGTGAHIDGGSHHAGEAITATDFSTALVDEFAKYDGGISAIGGYAVCRTNAIPGTAGNQCSIAGDGTTQWGLSVNNAGTLSGNIAAGVPEGSYALYVFAQNAQMGWNNVVAQTPTFTFAVIPTPPPPTTDNVTCPSVADMNNNIGKSAVTMMSADGHPYTFSASVPIPAGLQNLMYMYLDSGDSQAQCVYAGTGTETMTLSPIPAGSTVVASPPAAFHSDDNTCYAPGYDTSPSDCKLQWNNTFLANIEK